MSEKKFNIAVLIDGDNAQATLIKEIISEVSKYGKATIRRIYGDWTSSTMKSWKDVLNEYSINPIQKFSYTKSKNSTDSALIIDAMDILHNKSVEGFCIVSSDSDFTGLAKRIREEGLFVMGIGKKTTPIAFVNSCEIFTFSENIDLKENKENIENEKIQKPSSKLTDEVLELIDKAFEISTNEEEQTFIANVGGSLRKINPSFDARTYGFKNLSELFGNITKYEVIKNEVNGLNHPLVKLKTQ